MNNYLTFGIQNHLLLVNEIAQYESRGENSIELLSRLISLDPARFNNKNGIIIYGDSSPAFKSEWKDYDLKFCSTKINNEESLYLPFPCCYSLNWQQVGIEDGDLLTRELLFSDCHFEDDRLFWIGAETHESRKLLVALATQYPEILDCKFMSWIEGPNQSLFSPDFVSLKAHLRYKYVVDCPGRGYSGRLKWLISTGRPVFVIDRLHVEHWHSKLVPWKHYIPVKEDLSDLRQAYERIETSPDLYKEISCQAKHFAREHILLDKQLQSVLSAVPKTATVNCQIDASKTSIMKLVLGFDPNVQYDLEVAIPIHYRDKYKHRLSHFKRCGLFNACHFRMHITLLVDEIDWDHVDVLKNGWYDNPAISVLAMNSKTPLSKISAYYNWLSECTLNARWYLRVDDDSMTDIGRLIEFFDNKYNDSPVHAMTSPYVNGQGIQAFIRYFAGSSVPLTTTAHEHECSITSRAAMRQLFVSQTSMNFIRDSGKYVAQQGDQPLALAMLQADVPIAVNPFATKEFEFDRLALTGGHLHHIHYVKWEDSNFTTMATALLHGSRHALTDDLIKELLGVPLEFGRCIGKVLSRVTLAHHGRVSGATSYNESRWSILNGTLILTRSDGTATTIFDSVLTYGLRSWLLGFCLVDPVTHYLCSVNS